MSTSLCIDTQDWLGIDCVSIGDTGGGVLGSSIPSTGDAGSAYAYPMLVHPGDDGKEICGRITSIPAGLTLYAYEDTSSDASANDGTYVMYYQPYLDYVPFGSPLPVTYTFGTGNATAPGTTITGTSSIAGGAASGGASATAPGATLSAVGNISGGTATGAAAGTAPGATLSGASSIAGGAATGNSNATASGATLTATGSIAGGYASGDAVLRSNLNNAYTGTIRIRMLNGAKGMNFTPKRAAEIEIFTVDYVDQLAPGETVVSAVWSCSIYAGADASVATMIQGGASINGSQVSQLIRGGVQGTTYRPICTATTNLGQVKVLPEPGDGLLTIKG